MSSFAHAPAPIPVAWCCSGRSHFNEEPFLRGLLQLHGAAVEMRRRDFLSGTWANQILQAAQLRPTYRHLHPAEHRILVFVCGCAL